ncbi:hypothetical protein [Sungkyunkwania multivorans]
MVDQTPLIKVESAPKVIELNSRAKKEIRTWASFNSLNSKVEQMPSVSRYRLYTFTEELDVLYEELFEQEFPEKFNVPPVKSRLLVFRTFILKLKSKADDQRFSDEELTQGIVEIVEAFNNVKIQVNEISESDLDDDEMINFP